MFCIAVDFTSAGLRSAQPTAQPTAQPSSRAARFLVSPRRTFDDSDEDDSDEVSSGQRSSVHSSRSLSRFHDSPEDDDDHLFSSYEDQEAKYDFSWDVSEEDTHYNRHESRDGTNTQGSYSVMLPDGRKQIVTYYVDGHSGYVAKVSYEGVARHSLESLEDQYDY